MKRGRHRRTHRVARIVHGTACNFYIAYISWENKNEYILIISEELSFRWLVTSSPVESAKSIGSMFASQKIVEGLE
jgi:ribosomal protein L2